MRKFLWLAIAVVVVVVLWSGGWFWAAGEATRQVRLLGDADGETTPRLTCGTLDVTGYPFRFDLECLDAKVVSQDLTASFSGLKGSVLAYNPTHLIFSAKAPFSYVDAFSGSQRRLDFGALEGSVRVTADDLLQGFAGEGWRLARFSLIADDLVLTDTVAGDVVEARAKHFEAHLIDDPARHDRTAGSAVVNSFVTATALDLPGLNVVAADLNLDATLSGLPDDLRTFGDPDPLRRWQAAGGALTLTKLAGEQTSTDERFEITGELSLNGGGYLQGQISYTTKGVIDRLAPVLPAVQRAAVRGIPNGDGTFRNSFTITDGKIRLLAVPLFQLPPLF